MHLLQKLLCSPWFWLDVALSISGGIVVYWGLKVEKKAEKMAVPDNFTGDIFKDISEKQKTELERGWRILMRGIVMEVIAALGISILSGLEIADLHDKTEQASKDAGLANERAANAEAELAKLQFAVQWRTINAAQESNLVSMLKPFNHANFMLRKEVIVVTDQSDFEARWYAKKIIDVLRECGFVANLDSGFRMGDPNLPIPTGMGFFVNGPEPPPLAVDIKNAFSAVGIVPNIINLNTKAAFDGILRIEVWHKPEN